jgi:hypothetical protein
MTHNIDEKDFWIGRNYTVFSGELCQPMRYVIQTDFVVGMFAPIMNACRYPRRYSQI